jgi:uncharacterized protein
MKRRLASLCLLLLLAATVPGQQPSAAPAKPEGMPENMVVYQLGFLKKGPNSTPEKTAETSRIQEGHMAHLNAMGASGKLVVAGPVEKGEDLRGILVFKGITTEEAVRMASEDPAVKAGRLIVEIYPWWVEKGVLP